MNTLQSIVFSKSIPARTTDPFHSWQTSSRAPHVVSASKTCCSTRSGKCIFTSLCSTLHTVPYNSCGLRTSIKMFVFHSFFAWWSHRAFGLQFVAIPALAHVSLDGYFSSLRHFSMSDAGHHSNHSSHGHLRSGSASRPRTLAAAR